MRLITYLREQYIFHRYPFAKQFVKFLFVGSLITIIDFTLYFGLTRLLPWFGEHFLYANGIAFLTAVSLSFFANKFWTFRNDHPSYKKQYVKFFLTNLIGLLGNQSILYIFVTELAITDLIAKPVAVAVVVSWNFCAYKFWVFRTKGII